MEPGRKRGAHQYKGPPYHPMPRGRDRGVKSERGAVVPVYYSPGAFGPTTKTGPGFTRNVGDYGRYSQVRPGSGCGLASEKKYHDVDVDDAVVAQSVAIVATICTIPQGTTAVKRVGRKCCIKNIAWRFEISLPDVKEATDPVNVVEGDTVRVMMYLDSQCNGLAAPGSGVTGILETDDYLSFNNLSNKGRFRVLFDRFYTLNRLAALVANPFDTNTRLYTTPEVIVADSFYKKCDIPIEWDTNNTTGAIGSIRSNNLGILLISRNGTASAVSFKSSIRLRFED